MTRRREALVGLASRLDPRAFPHVRRALSRPGGEVWALELIAAGALGDSRLHRLVLRHQVGWDDPQDARAADAVRRLTDPRGPGQDVVDGVAELYRRRAHGQPEDDIAAWCELMDHMLDIAPRRAPEFLAAVLTSLHPDQAAMHVVMTESALAQLSQ